MARKYRVKCPKCGNVQNLIAPAPCAKCGEPLELEQPGLLGIYRMGNFVGAAAGFGIYLDGQPYGQIGNQESLYLPLPYGEYKLHIVCGMNRKCNGPVIKLSPEDPFVCVKVHINMGFIQNKLVIERADPSTMPRD